MIMKIARFFLGILFLPLCWISMRTMISLIQAIHPSLYSAISFSSMAICGGFLLWLFLYFMFPRPVRSYVLAHELTHALWGELMGAKVSHIKISEKGGSVRLSKNNFFITLAPYFFPFYTVIAVIIYCVLSIFFEMENYDLYWLALVGLTWGFHFTFTITALLQHQDDIHKYGYVFSYAVIFIFNILGICFWIVAVSSATLEQMMNFMTANLSLIAQGIWSELTSH